jgi:DNA topoisomerase IB
MQKYQIKIIIFKKINTPSDIPKSGKSFNQELRDIFLQDKLKKHSNLKVKQLLIHPGDANAMKKSYRN